MPEKIEGDVDGILATTDPLKRKMQAFRLRINNLEKVSNSDWRLALRSATGSLWLCWRKYGATSHAKESFSPQCFKEEEFEVERSDINKEAKLALYKIKIG